MRSISQLMIILAIGVLMALSGFARNVAASEEGEGETPAKSGQQAWLENNGTESQFIIRTIVENIAALAIYADKESVPTEEEFDVTVESASDDDLTPKYNVALEIEGVESTLQFTLEFEQGHIWSNELYTEIAEKVLSALELKAVAPRSESLSSQNFAQNLLYFRGVDIEFLNGVHAKYFKDNILYGPAHEEAALLLTVLALREFGGLLYDVRIPLSRATAHLALANVLNKESDPASMHTLASAIIDVIAKDERKANRRIELLKSSGEAIYRKWADALALLSTNDYRFANQIDELTFVVEIAYIAAVSRSISGDKAWSLFETSWVVSNPVYHRIIVTSEHDISLGHELNELMLRSELSEAMRVGSRFFKDLKSDDYGTLVKRLNSPVSTSPFHEGTPMAIPWSLWAYTLQRNILNVTAETGLFMKNVWGVEVDGYYDQMADLFGEWRLFPIMQYILAHDKESYEELKPDYIRLLNEEPHYLPFGAWDELLKDVRIGNTIHKTVDDTNLRNYYSELFPAGTFYGTDRRNEYLQDFLSKNKIDPIRYARRVANQAPHLYSVLGKLVVDSLNERQIEPATADELLEPLLQFHSQAIGLSAQAWNDVPEKFEERMLRAAEHEPNYLPSLANYFFLRNDREKAAKYLEEMLKTRGASHLVFTNHARWLVDYYADKGEWLKAKRVAEVGLEVYSGDGLIAAARFEELRGNWKRAIQIHGLFEERYDSFYSTIGFIVRHYNNPSPEVQELVSKYLPSYFPNGIEKVTLDSIKDAPLDGGVYLTNPTKVSEDFGFQHGDMILAMNGIRIRNYTQFECISMATLDGRLSWLVYDNKTDEYREIKQTMLRGQIGGNMQDWTPK